MIKSEYMANTGLQALMLLAVAAALSAMPARGAGLYKWTDDQGIVHYSDQLPADGINKGGVVIDKQGRQVKKIDAMLTPAQAKAKEAEDERQRLIAKGQEDKSRRDIALTHSYTSEEEIDFARTQVNAEFACQDIADFLESRPVASVDRIFALNILEHLDKDKLVRVLESAHRCLRPGGRLVAMVPNATSPFGGMTRYWDITHYNAFTPSSVRQLSRLTGFAESAEFRECGPVPYALVSGLRYALWQMIRLVIKAYLLVELASDKGGIYTADMMFRLTKPGADRG